GRRQRYRDRIVGVEAAIDRICAGVWSSCGGALNVIRVPCRGELQAVGAFLARPFVQRKRFWEAIRRGKSAPKHHRVLDRNACTLAKKWRHWMSGVTKHVHAPFRVLRKRFAITKAPLEQRSRRDRMNELQRRGIKIAVDTRELLHRSGNSPSLLLPVRLATNSNHIHDGSMAQRVVQEISPGADKHRKR